MNQRRGGAALMAIVVLILVLTSLASGPDVTGAGQRAPLPLPPPVGACLSGPENLVVPCDQLHEREVVANWTAEEELPAGSRTEFCTSAVSDYVGVQRINLTTAWQNPVLPYTNSWLTAPPEERAYMLGWRACVVESYYLEPFRGSTKNLATNPTPPATFGSCANGNLVPVVDANVSCAVPHEVQVLGYAYGFVPLASEQPDLPAGVEIPLPLPPQETLASECQEIAADLLATEDPSYGDRLVVESRYTETSTQYFSYSAIGTENEPINGTSQNATCIVRAAHLGILTDTLIGNGTKPLPIQ